MKKTEGKFGKMAGKMKMPERKSEFSELDLASLDEEELPEEEPEMDIEEEDMDMEMEAEMPPAGTDLAAIPDEELIAEMKKRGLNLEDSEEALPEMEEETESADLEMNS